MRQAGLLRGINVGGKHTVPMAALRELLQSLGASQVRTLGNSGNAVWTAPPAGPLQAPAIAEALRARFPFAVPTLVYPSQQFCALLAANPFAARGVAAGLHLVFLEQALPPDVYARLQHLAAPPEELAAAPGVLYLHLPGGVSGSALGKALLKVQGGVVGTMRTWAVAGKLAALL